MSQNIVPIPRVSSVHNNATGSVSDDVQDSHSTAYSEFANGSCVGVVG